MFAVSLKVFISCFEIVREIPCRKFHCCTAQFKMIMEPSGCEHNPRWRVWCMGAGRESVDGRMYPSWNGARSLQSDWRWEGLWELLNPTNPPPTQTHQHILWLLIFLTVQVRAHSRMQLAPFSSSKLWIYLLIQNFALSVYFRISFFQFTIKFFKNWSQPICGWNL